MATKLYFHVDTAADLGTSPPTTKRTGLTIGNYMGAAQTLNLACDTSIGPAQDLNSGTSTATTATQIMYAQRFFSPPLAAATIGGSSITLTINVANEQSNAAMNFGTAIRIHVSVWRPSTNSFLGAGPTADYLNAVTVTSGLAEPGAASSERVNHGTLTVTPASVTVQSGDRLCIEVMWSFGQSMSASYTGTFYYDGTTENTTTNSTVTNHASFIELSETIAFTGGTITCDANFTLGAMTTTADGDVAVAGAYNANFGAMTTTSATAVSVVGDSTFTFGAMTITADATPDIVDCDASFTFDAMTTTSAGSINVVGDGTLSFGGMTTTADGSALVVGTSTTTFDAMTLGSDASVPVVIELNATFDAMTVASTVTVGSAGITGEADITFSAMTLSSAAAALASAAASLAMNAMTATSDAVVSVVGSASITFGAMSTTSGAAVGLTTTANFTLGAMTIESTAGEIIFMTGLEAFVSDYTGTTNDRLKQLLLANGATSGTIDDLWMQFFTAKGFTSGALLDRMRQFLLDYTGAADTGQTIQDLWSLVTGPYAPFLLDAWGDGAEAAYSTRQLSSTATLALQARNATGTIIEDIGFVDGILDTATLAAAFAADTGRVGTWYDQSTGQEDMVQATHATRPHIVDNGSVAVMPGGQPALYADVATVVMSIPNGATNAVKSIFCVFRDTTAANPGRWTLASNAGGTIVVMAGGDANTGPGYINGASTVQSGTEDNNKHVISVVLSGTTATVHLDNTSLGTIGSLSDLGPIETVFGGITDGLVGELVLFSTDKSDDRLAITQDMATYWGVTLA